MCIPIDGVENGGTKGVLLMMPQMAVKFWSAAAAVLDSSVEVLELPAQSCCWSQPDDGVSRFSGSELVVLPSCVPTTVVLLPRTLGPPS